MPRDHGIQLHFSSNHINYYSAWQYVTKSDSNYVQSEGHPDLTLMEPPRTAKGPESRKRNYILTSSTKSTDANKKNLEKKASYSCRSIRYHTAKEYKNKNRTLCTC